MTEVKAELMEKEKLAREKYLQYRFWRPISANW